MGRQGQSILQFLHNNDIEIYSTHNWEKFVIVERLIRTLKINFINRWLQYQKCVCW